MKSDSSPDVAETESQSRKTLTSGRRVGASIALATLRFRRTTTVALVSISALCFASIVVLLALPSLVADRSVRHTLEGLPLSERVVSVVVGPEKRPTPAERDGIDRTIRTQLAVPGLGATSRVVLFRALSDRDDDEYRLTGATNLRTIARLQSGRWPTSCTPQRCEVVAVAFGDTGPAVATAAEDVDPAAAGSADGSADGSTPDSIDVPGLAVVGSITPTDLFPFVGQLAAGPTETLLIADDPEKVHAFLPLQLIRRVDGWVAPVEPQRTDRAQVLRLLDRAAGLPAAVDLAGMSVEAPEDELLGALDRSESSGRTIALAGAQLLAALGLAWLTVLLAEHETDQASVARLVRRGASSATFRARRLMLAAAPVGAGALLGIGAGALAVVAVAQAWSVSLHGVRALLWSAGTAAWLLLAIGVLMVLHLAVGTATTGTGSPSVVGRFRIRDVVGVAVIGGLLVACVRTIQRASGLASDGPTRASAWMWPLAVSLATVVVVLRTQSIRTRFSRTAGLLAVGSRDVVVGLGAALSAVAVGSCLIAVGARETVRTQARDQGVSSAPTDFRLGVGRSLVRPAELRASPQWAKIRERTTSSDVLRRGVGLLTGTGDNTLEVLGVEPTILTNVRSWRRDYGPSPARVAKALTTAAPPAIGVPIPADAGEIVVQIDGVDEQLQVAAVLARSDGSWHETILRPDQVGVLPATTSGPASDPTSGPPLSAASLGTPSGTLRGALEPADQLGSFIGVRISVDGEFAAQLEHAIGEGSSSTGTDIGASTFTGEKTANLVLRGVATTPLATKAAALRPLNLDLALLTSEQAILNQEAEGALEIRLALQGRSALIVPAGGSDPLPAHVDQQTAELAGGVGATFVAETLGKRLSFVVSSIGTHFPTVGDRFLVADLARLSRELNLAQPGVGTASELWLAANRAGDESTVAALLRAAPFDRLELTDRIAIETSQRRDPLRNIAVQIMLAAAIASMLAATIAAALAAHRVLRSQNNFRNTLLLDGITETAIRRTIRTQMIWSTLASIPIAVMAGILSLRLIARDIAPVGTDTSSLPLRVLLPTFPAILISVLVICCVAIGVACGIGAVPIVHREDLLRDSA